MNNAGAFERHFKSFNERDYHHFQDRRITKREAAKLKMERRDIKRDRRRALANDGKIGPLERRHIRRDKKVLRRNTVRAIRH